MKKCPFCAEEIQDEAIKCKHCGERLDNNQIPKTSPEEIQVSLDSQSEKLKEKEESILNTNVSDLPKKISKIPARTVILFALLLLAIIFYFGEFERKTPYRKTPYQNNKKSFSQSSKVDSKYIGTHNGSWEGFVLGQSNSGRATFKVKNNGNSSLTLSSNRYGDVVHNGKVIGNKFFIDDKSDYQSIVDMNSGFKIVLIWTGMNTDVYFY